MPSAHTAPAASHDRERAATFRCSCAGHVNLHTKRIVHNAARRFLPPRAPGSALWLVTGNLTGIAPVRLDFGGGWTDVPPYSDEQGGFVCNIAISRYVTARMAALPAGAPAESGDRALAEAAMRQAGVTGAQLVLSSDFPVGAGLGGSSAAGVAALGLLAAERGDTLEPAELAEASRRLEVEGLLVAGGRQDHYAAAFGGALALRFGDGVEVRRLPLSGAVVNALERRCIVAYTGRSRISAANITAVLDAYRRGEAVVVDALHRLRTLAELMAPALSEGDLDELGRLVDEHWSHQRRLHRAIPTPLIDEIIARARTAGALGGKALGASGGGCVLVIAPDDRVDHVRSAVGSLAELLSFSVDHEGFRVTEC